MFYSITDELAKDHNKINSCIYEYSSTKDLDCVHSMPEQFENGNKFDYEKSLQDIDAKEMFLHPKN